MNFLKRSISNSIIKSMQEKRVYHSSYDTNIDILTDTIIQYYFIIGQKNTTIKNDVLNNLKNTIVEYAVSLKLSRQDLLNVIEENESKIKLFKSHE